MPEATQPFLPKHMPACPTTVHKAQAGTLPLQIQIQQKATVTDTSISNKKPKEQENTRLTSSLNHASKASSSNSPIPSRHARTITSAHPCTFFTMLDFASDRLTINSRALNRNVDFSSSSSSTWPPSASASALLDAGEGGKTKTDLPFSAVPPADD